MGAAGLKPISSIKVNSLFSFLLSLVLAPAFGLGQTCFGLRLEKGERGGKTGLAPSTVGPDYVKTVGENRRNEKLSSSHSVNIIAYFVFIVL